MALFETLATACAPAVAAELLAAIALVESGGEPLAFRDQGKIEVAPSAGRALAAVVGAADGGREAGLGLMGLTELRLREVGVALVDAFEPCAALRASQLLIERERKVAERAGVEMSLLDRVAIKSWWRPDGRYTSSGAYWAAIVQARERAKEMLSKEVGGVAPAPVARETAAVAGAVRMNVKGPAKAAPLAPGTPALAETALAEIEPPAWDVFGRARGNGALVFQRRN